MGPWRRAAAWAALTLAALATACSASTDDTDGPDPHVPGDLGDAGSSSTSAPPGQPGAPPASQIPTVPVGERVLAAGYELVVHEVTAPAPSATAAPGPGRMLMSVDVELVNRTSSARDATFLRLEVVDAAGAHYAPSPAGDSPPTGWIPADVPKRGVQLYEVPIDATGLVLTLQPDLVSDVAAVVRLN